ncbi:hypothetical protein LEMLEM_LOCUS26568 [Lemmus lemmus]
MQRSGEMSQATLSALTPGPASWACRASPLGGTTGKSS